MELTLQSRRRGRWRSATAAGTVVGVLSTLVGLQTAVAPAAAALENGLALTPPMGWNSWNKFHCNVTEAKVKAVVDAITAQGLDDVGYKYVTVDDCWMAGTRDANGNLRSDPVKFPSGMAALGDYIHGKGLKFGIYQSPTEKTCQHLPGSYGHEQQDANTFASWGVDYLKYDWCNALPNESPTMWAAFPGKTEKEISQALFTRMRDALAATGRPIVYSLSDWRTVSGFPEWAAPVGNLWRTSTDIYDGWNAVLRNFRLAAAHTYAAGPGHWNDPDMLEVGNGGMSDTEYRTHFSLWAQLAAPLIMGHDVPTATAATIQTLKNTDVIAVDQDSLGKQGRIVMDADGQLVTARPLANGDLSVTLTNTAGTTATVATSATQLGIHGAAAYAFKDLWTQGTSSTTEPISATLAPHATVMYRITPSGPTNPLPTNGTYEIASAASTQTLDNPNGNTTAGTKMTTWMRNNGNNQRWALTANSDGSFTIKNNASGQCLDVAGASTATGAPLIQWPCHSGNNQRFTATPAPGGGHLLKAKHSGLAIIASNPYNNASLSQRPGDPSSPTHIWHLTEIG
ncbi:alpha-galactosidase [Streptomyces gardneri]|uniref:alpha-galactosidase n=1 Tax=Streptomyces gardneri TaxID=66892 RepID=UPI0036C8C075